MFVTPYNILLYPTTFFIQFFFFRLLNQEYATRLSTPVVVWQTEGVLLFDQNTFIWVKYTDTSNKVHHANLLMIIIKNVCGSY
jgi:hypothetical protein